MKMFARSFMLACVPLMTVGGYSQTAASTTAPAADVATAKEIAGMEAKLADWPQLGRYRAANAALPPVAAGENRVVFFGDSITDNWGGGQGRRARFLQGSPM